MTIEEAEFWEWIKESDYWGLNTEDMKFGYLQGRRDERKKGQREMERLRKKIKELRSVSLSEGINRLAKDTQKYCDKELKALGEKEAKQRKL